MARVPVGSWVSSCTVRSVEHDEADPWPLTFEVVFICTANRARSPFAAALLRRHLAGLPVAVKSFGTIEEAGASALSAAVRAADAFGVDLTEHRARPLSPGALVTTDLAIGFEQFHVASAVVVGGARRSRTFLLTELSYALEDLGTTTPSDDPDVHELVARADVRRAARERLPRSLADPVGSSDLRFLELYHEIDRLVSIIAVRLFGAVGERTG
jgi:protein-tyrosine-phosphatase